MTITRDQSGMDRTRGNFQYREVESNPSCQYTSTCKFSYVPLWFVRIRFIAVRARGIFISRAVEHARK